jgi:hypothetical protein
MNAVLVEEASRGENNGRDEVLKCGECLPSRSFREHLVFR